MKPSRLSAQSLRGRKGAHFPVVTVYDAAFARVVEAAGIDTVLVGDSLGMVVLGAANTLQVMLADIERHTAAVARGSERLHIIADLPFGTVEASDADAVRAAIALIRAGAGAVKVEGGIERAPRLRAIVDAGIPVVAHLGVQPQTAALEAGFRRRRDRDRLFAELDAVVASGVYAVVLEMVAADLAAELTEHAAIPTIGIGSGAACDGQVMVLHDLLGLYPHPPPFAKRYVDLATVAQGALENYAADVRSGRFPE